MNLDVRNISHANLFLSENLEEAEKHAVAIAVELERPKEKNVHFPSLLDVAVFRAGENGSVGIDEARAVKEFLFKRPFKSPRRTAIIADGDALTDEAQNALLKVAEEPPAEALIIILAKRAENILPTLRSRLHIEHLESEEDAAANPALAHAKKFMKASAHERTETIKDVVGRKDTDPDLTKPFLNALILELAKDKVKNSALLAGALERQRLLGDHPLNKRLQLEFLSALWYN